MKSSPYSKFIVAAIHGFLFAAIAITTYSLVNDLYNSWLNPITEGMININSGIKYTYDTPGPKNFNDPSTTPLTIAKPTNQNGPNIKCGKNNVCGSADPSSKQVYCYGNKNGCLWGNDCNTDSDCKKYNDKSAKFPDTSASYHNSYICPNFKEGDWPAEFCQFQKIPIKQ